MIDYKFYIKKYPHELKVTFRKFLEGKMNEENLEFLDELEKLRISNDKKTAFNVFDLYLNDVSDKRLNVSKSEVLKVKNLLNSEGNNLDYFNMFCSIENEILILVNETFNDFKLTKEFKQFSDNSIKIDNLLKINSYKNDKSPVGLMEENSLKMDWKFPVVDESTKKSKIKINLPWVRWLL